MVRNSKIPHHDWSPNEIPHHEFLTMFQDWGDANLGNSKIPHHDSGATKIPHHEFLTMPGEDFMLSPPPQVHDRGSGR